MEETKKTSSRIDVAAKAIILTLTAALLIVAIADIANGGEQSKRQTNRESSGDAAITVSALTAEPSYVERAIRLNGEVASRSEVSIYPDAAGKIVRIIKDEGDSVLKGGIIAYVDPSTPGSAYALSPVESTIAGTVVELPVKAGDTVTTQTAIATVGSVSDLKVSASVPEKYSTILKPGMPAYIELNSLPNEKISASVSSVSPVVNKTKRTIDVTILFTEYDPRIKPGMFASVYLVTEYSENAIVLPKTALTTYNAGDAVYIIDENNKAARRIVEVGISNDIESEIVSGLSFGDRVIIAGSVTDGVSVRIAE